MVRDRLYSSKRGLEDLCLRFAKAMPLLAERSASVPRLLMAEQRPLGYLMHAASAPPVTSRLARVDLDRLEVGETTYRLQKVLRGRFDSEEGELLFDDLGRAFAGRGTTVSDALSDFRLKIHEKFQKLYRMEPFEMSGDEEREWSTLQECLDVALYFDNTPIEFRRIGRLVRADPGQPRLVEWADGTSSCVDLERAPGEFASFPAGQWYEAVVSFHAVDGTLLRILHVQAIEPLESAEDFWDTLRTTADKE